MNINTLAWLYACQNPEDDDKGYALSSPLPFTTTKLFRLHYHICCDFYGIIVHTLNSHWYIKGLQRIISCYYLFVRHIILCNVSAATVTTGLSVFRHHHRTDNVHHHHRCVGLYATGVLRKSCRHLSMGELPVCLSVSHRVCCGQLFHHSGGDEEAEESKGQLLSKIFSNLLSYLAHRSRCAAIRQSPETNSDLLSSLCRCPPLTMLLRLWPLMGVSTTMKLTWPPSPPAPQIQKGTSSLETRLSPHPQKAPGYVASTL